MPMPPNPLYFRTTEEMLEEFAYLGEEKAYEVVVTNTQLVASWCDEVKPLPDGLFAPKLENSAEELYNLVWGKAHELYREDPPQIVKDRIELELPGIIERKYDVIYMSAQKLVQNSLEHGYLVGSRGSVGSSIVAFLSGITEVNSLPPHYQRPQCKHSDFAAGGRPTARGGHARRRVPICGTKYVKDGFNIPLRPSWATGARRSPDIDLNFSGEYQANAHKYTFELFGGGPRLPGRHHRYRGGEDRLRLREEVPGRPGSPGDQGRGEPFGPGLHGSGGPPASTPAAWWSFPRTMRSMTSALSSTPPTTRARISSPPTSTTTRWRITS